MSSGNGNKLTPPGDFEKASSIAPWIFLVVMLFLYSVLIRNCNSFGEIEGKEGHGHGGGHNTEATAPVEIDKEVAEEVIGTDSAEVKEVKAEEAKVEEKKAE